MQIAFSVFMFVLGACLGSFLCCMARRLHLKESKKPVKNKRSICLHCRYQLKWYDNIPIISWILLEGKCRKCGKKIGLVEFLSELGLATAFAAVTATTDLLSATPLEWGIYLATIAIITSLGFLAIYDGKWGELPNFAIIISIILAIIIAVLKQPQIVDVFASVAILAGLYFILYIVSKGKWVGDGDWLLGLAIGLSLADPWLAAITLFIANLSACVIMAPVVKKTKKRTIHFGPFLVLAFVITLTIKDVIISI